MGGGHGAQLSSCRRAGWPLGGRRLSALTSVRDASCTPLGAHRHRRALHDALGGVPTRGRPSHGGQGGHLPLLPGPPSRLPHGRRPRPRPTRRGRPAWARAREYQRPLADRGGVGAARVVCTHAVARGMIVPRRAAVGLACRVGEVVMREMVRVLRRVRSAGCGDHGRTHTLRQTRTTHSHTVSRSLAHSLTRTHTHTPTPRTHVCATLTATK